MAVAGLGLVAAVDGKLIAGPAVAQTDDAAEKDAFEAAKSLGTVEAWDAFLTHYSSGFRADLARAYVKKLAEQPAAATPAVPAVNPAPQTGAAPPPSFDYPMVAGSWGGIVRKGPGQAYSEVGRLKEGEEVTLMAPPIHVENGFPWFKIAYGDDERAFMWGGLICSTGAERPDMFKLCTFTPVRQDHASEEPREEKSAKPKNRTSETRKEPKRKGCSEGRTLVDGQCVKKRDANAVCGPGFHREGTKCVAGYRAPKPNAPLTSWQKEAIQKGCPKGMAWNKQEGCHEDD